MNDARSYYVYILASRHHGTLYIGITSDIRVRLEHHRRTRLRIREKVWGLPSREPGNICDAAGGDCTREATEVLEARLEIKLIDKENPDWNDRSGLI